MNKQVARVLVIFGLWIIFCVYWYSCNIKFLCNKGLAGLSLPGLSQIVSPKAENSVESVNNEMNIPIRFAEGLGVAVVDNKLKEELAKLTADVKNGSLVIVSGQNESSMGGVVSSTLADMRVASTVDVLEKNGIAKDKIIVSVEGTMDSLNLEKYKLENRRVVLIIGGLNTK